MPVAALRAARSPRPTAFAGRGASAALPRGVALSCYTQRLALTVGRKDRQRVGGSAHETDAGSAQSGWHPHRHWVVRNSPMSQDLEPIEPGVAKEMYLDSRTDIAKSTRKTHSKRLTRFADWCDAQDITDMNTLSGRDCRRYRIDEFDEREDGGEYSPETVRGYVDTLRVFLQFCVSIDAVPPELPEKVQSPRPNKSRDEELTAERADEILSNLRKYEYASVRHVLVALMWRIGIRLGTARSIDLCDVDTDAQRVEVRHEPRDGTPLKNQWTAEREVAVGDDTTQLLRDYIDQNRIRVTDDAGNKPLLTSNQGRRSKSNLRELVYTSTRPCEWGECPHNRDPEECDAAQAAHHASKCPSTRSPHPTRRGAISTMLREGVPKAVVADRADLSPDVLDEHYSTLTEDEKAERRREYLKDAFDGEY